MAARQGSGATDWQPATWRQLEPRGLQLQIVDKLEGTDTGNSCTVAVRADIADLTDLWKQRIQYRSAHVAVLYHRRRHCTYRL